MATERETRELSTRRDERVESVKQDERPTLGPSVDIFEGKEDILLFADMPGVSPQSVRVHLEKGELRFEGTRELPAPAGERGPRELRYGRSFAVQGIDANKIEAELSAGVLRLRLPKSDALRPRQITVKAG